MNDWNEWTAGKYPTAAGQTTPFMRRKSNYYFVDQYDVEFNRTIQPMEKDGYTDNYYMQMAENLRRYKGVRPIPEIHGEHTIKIDGDFDDWKSSTVRYTADHHRRHRPPRRPRLRRPALQKRLRPQRHHHVQSRLRRRQRLFLRRNQRAPNAPHRQQLDAPPHRRRQKSQKQAGSATTTSSTRKSSTTKKATTLQKYDPKSPDHPWVEQAKLNYRYKGKMLELSIPRKLLNLTKDQCTFDFKWADNPADLKDPISLCTNGDTAPNRRFNYRCVFRIANSRH